MPHKPGRLLWSTSLALAIVTSFTLATDSNAQATLQPYAPPILHKFQSCYLKKYIERPNPPVRAGG